MSSLTHKTIGLRLLRYVFGCYFVVTLILTSIQLSSVYLHTKENLFHELSNLGDTLEDNLKLSIWNYDIEQLESTLSGINKLEIVSGTKITDQDGQLLVNSFDVPKKEERDFKSQKKGDFGKGSINEISYQKDEKIHSLFEYRHPIKYSNEDKNIIEFIGYFYIYSNHAEVINRIKYSFILIIINSLIKTIALWFIFLYFTKRIVAKPLGLLTEATNDFDPNKPETFESNKKLDSIIDRKNDDEINQLAHSFTKMRDSIIENIRLIKTHNMTLEQKVKERTETIEKTNKKLKHLSLHDELTGLPNRNLFRDRLENMLYQAGKKGFRFSVASVDLRKFKEINDTFGHQAGDTVLKEISKRMQETIRKSDTIARVGGDEFAILLEDADQNTIHRVGEEIISCGDKPITVDNNSILAGINIGFSIYPQHGTDPETLFRKADVAMYLAKKNQDGKFIFTSEANRELKRQKIITTELSSSIDSTQFSLHYQPILRGKNHQVKGVEALIRWNHPELGNIPPDEFIAIAERSSAIKKITDWVSRQALTDAMKINDAGYDLSTSINISGRLLNDSSLPDSLNKLLQNYDIPAKKIILELTESSVMHNPDQTMDVLNQLKKLGFMLSIDDFGTGYSSFAYLARLPVNELKIDRSFLNNFNDNSQTVIESIIELAHRLNLTVVAEGVEDDKILKIIEDLNGDYIQGYHFCRPIPLDELLPWLEEFNNKT